MPTVESVRTTIPIALAARHLITPWVNRPLMFREKRLGNLTPIRMIGAKKRIQLRQAAIFTLADSDYGRRVSEGLGLDMKEVERLSAMSQEERAKATDRGAFGDY